MSYDLNNLKWLTAHHPPDEVKIIQHQNVRFAALSLLEAIRDNTPVCADQSLAITKVREGMMWANAAIALDGKR